MLEDGMTMDARANWALFYKHEGGIPREFCEVRQVDSAVWVRSGAVRTWGSLTTMESASSEEARTVFSRTCDEQAAQDWAPTRTGQHDPDRFDFDLLQKEIRDGARQAFAIIRGAHPDETIIGFALVTDESAMTIGAIAISEEALQQHDAGEESRWMPDEWPYGEGGEHLDVAYRLLLARQQDVPTNVPFEEFRDGAFEAAIRALEELDREQLFGEGEARDRIFILLHVSDADEPNESVRRLNSQARTAEYEAWYQSWA